MTNELKKTLIWIVSLVVVFALSVGLGVSYPLPQPADIGAGAQAEGDTNFTNVVTSGYVTVGTDITLGDDLTVADTLDVNGDIDLDGDGFDVNVTAGFSIDGDAASNINVAGAGIDLTLESEAGRVVIKGDEAAADGVYIDANDAAGTGVDIDVGASGGLAIDGGLMDIGGGTCGVADGDNDVCIAAVLEVDGELEADGAIDADAGMTIDGGVTNIGGGTPDVAAGDNDLYVTGDLEVDGELELDGTIDVDGVMTGQDDLEHVFFPTVASTAFTYTAAAGGTVALFTVGDGEIWFVHGVWLSVTTNFDCTGNDCVAVLGDGNDTDGFCVLADAELQTADTEGTGWTAGWQCQVAATRGVYQDGTGGFIYAPSGAAETIDVVLSAAGDDFSAGAATAYIVYTRIQ